MNQTTRKAEFMRTDAILHMALELGASEWKLAFGVEAGQKPRLRTARLSTTAVTNATKTITPT